jgi:Zn-dependent M28 family amino/carboxypeptidase
LQFAFVESLIESRYYKATTGRDSSAWILKQVQTLVANAGVKKATAANFTHSWIQPSVILSIPGKSDKTVILGAHQDSINLNNPSSGRAPGADDDGTGVVTILEALRVLLTDSRIASNSQENTIELHFYAAEEGGLLGSQAIFQDYQKKGRNVVAFLQQDMTGYTKGTISAGRKESIGLLTDYVDTGLTAFVKRVIAAVSVGIPSHVIPCYLKQLLGLQCDLRCSHSTQHFPPWIRDVGMHALIMRRPTRQAFRRLRLARVASMTCRLTNTRPRILSIL